MPASLIALLVLAQNRQDTLGKTNAQILAMGHRAWYAFYTGREGESTAAMTSAEALYGDALMERTDRLKNPRTMALRKALQETKNDAIGVGTALSGGGTLWNIVGSGLYVDAEETLYAVLTKTAKAPRRVVSDVERSYAKLRTAAKEAKVGLSELARLRKDLNALIAEAKRMPRRESDALLDFGVRALDAALSNP